MRITAKCLATTSLVLVTTAFASSSWAAELNATTAIDTVTVYPDGATRHPRHRGGPAVW